MGLIRDRKVVDEKSDALEGVALDELLGKSAVGLEEGKYQKIRTKITKNKAAYVQLEGYFNVHE